MRWSQNKKNRARVEFTIPNDQKKGGFVPNSRTQNSVKSRNGFWLLLAGLNRWLVAGKYQSHRVQRTWFTKSNILWLKIGVAGFAVLMVMRNDFQFTINFSGAQAKTERLKPASDGIEKMGIVQSVALKPSTTTTTRKRVAAKEKNKEARIEVKDISQYVSHYTDMAKEEMRRYGIPASLKMAQAILASEGGQSASVESYHNHFGRHLKGINFEDDKTNWRAHSLYLIENYPQLLNAGATYMDWVKALESTDYSYDENYTNQLLTIIKDYKLYQLDY